MYHTRYISANIGIKLTQQLKRLKLLTMTIRDETIMELLDKTTTKVMGQPTHA